MLKVDCLDKGHKSKLKCNVFKLFRYWEWVFLLMGWLVTSMPGGVRTHLGIISIVLCLVVFVHIMVCSGSVLLKLPAIFHIVAKSHWTVQWFIQANQKTSPSPLLISIDVVITLSILLGRRHPDFLKLFNMSHVFIWPFWRNLSPSSAGGSWILTDWSTPGTCHWKHPSSCCFQTRIIRKELHQPTLDRGGDMNFQRYMIPFWKHQELKCFQWWVSQVDQSAATTRRMVSPKYLDQKCKCFLTVLRYLWHLGIGFEPYISIPYFSPA